MKKKKRFAKNIIQLDDVYINHKKNQPIGTKELEVLFNNIKHTKWYKINKIKIILINFNPLINRQEKLIKQKVTFIRFFNQHYNLNYSYRIKNDEFEYIYNKKFTFLKFIKPY